MKNTLTKKLKLGILAFALLLGSIPIYSIPTNAQSTECDTTYYATNDILYYNPCEVCSTASSSLTGNSNEEKVFKWFVSKGFNAAQAAGMMGNISVESSFNPFRMQTTYSNSGIESVLPPDAHRDYNRAFGLVQWDGGRRQQVLRKTIEKFPDHVTLINSYGKSADGYKEAEPAKNDAFLTFQLEFVYQELETGYTHVFNEIKAQPDTEEGVSNAAEIWNRKYEVSADRTQKRHEIAKGYYAQFKDSAASIGTGGAGTASTMGCGKPAGEVVWYSQCDPKWASVGYAGDTICNVGCGPTSMAIILASLVDKNIKPTDVAAVAGNQSGGTSWQPLINGVNEKWNLNISGKPLSMDEAVEFVKSGKGYVWMGGTGNPPFTKNGHMVAMVGVTTDGKVTIADPYGGTGEGHQKTANYTVAEIEAQTGSGIFGVPKK